MKIKWYSPSTLKMVAECLRRKKLEPFREGDALRLGRFRHAVLSLWYRLGKGGIAPHYHALVKQKSEGHDLAGQEVLDDLEQYAARYPLVPLENVLTNEGSPPFPDGHHTVLYEKAMFQVQLGEDWGVRGIIDLAYYDPEWDGIVVVDHKGRSEEDVLIQGCAYIVAGVAMWGMPRIRFEARGVPPFWSARLEVKEEAPWGPDEISLGHARALLFGLAKRLQEAEAKNEWPATAGGGCDYCTVKEGCPALGDNALVEAPKSWLPAKLRELEAPELIRIFDRAKTHIAALEAVEGMVKEIVIPKLEATGGFCEVDGKQRKLASRNYYETDHQGLEVIGDLLGVTKTPHVRTDWSSYEAEIERTITGLPPEDRKKWLEQLKMTKTVKSTSKWVSSPRGIHDATGLLPGEK